MFQSHFLWFIYCFISSIWLFYISFVAPAPTVITNNLITLPLCHSAIISFRFSCLEVSIKIFGSMLISVAVYFLSDNFLFQWPFCLPWNIRKPNSTKNTFIVFNILWFVKFVSMFGKTRDIWFYYIKTFGSKSAF